MSHIRYSIAIAAMSLPCALTAQGSPAVPPPIEQDTANCRQAVYATDQLVCTTPELMELDNRLAAAVRVSPVQSPSAWLETQSQWFRRRSLCAFRADHINCARAAYHERLVITRPSIHTLITARAACNDRSVRRVSIEQDQVRLFGVAGNLLGVGFPTAGLAGWTPFLRIARAGRTLIGSAVSGADLRCRLTYIH